MASATQPSNEGPAPGAAAPGSPAAPPAPSVDPPAGGAPAATGHAGAHAVAAAAAAGARTMFTLSGAHVFPLYDGAVKSAVDMRLLDVRHEATAVFAAEATGKLTRTPGFAVVTAGPGVTNALSPITQAHFAGSPLVVLGGRAPRANWGKGTLQELDQPPIFTTVTKRSWTVLDGLGTGAAVADAFATAGSAHRGPVFLDVPMDELFRFGPPPAAGATAAARPDPDPDAIARIAALLAAAERPVLILGTDVWADGAERAARELVAGLGLPTITNGMARGIVPGGHPLLVTRARRAALTSCDLAVVVGTPLDFRLGYGRFGASSAPAQVVHIADAKEQLSSHATLAAAAAGDLTQLLDGLHRATTPGNWAPWVARLQRDVAAAAASDRELFAAASDPIHPARIYGELLPRLAEDAVVIGDGGDFVSWAGKFIEPAAPGGWLDPGPYGCLGAGLGAAIAARIARPGAQVVLLLGDGAAGMSLMDVDTLVRHDLPVVMVVGNNSAWGLEKHPMRMIYGYDVIADLAPETRYDSVVGALGGAGETVRRPQDVGPALDRAMSAGVPYLVNVLTDVEVAYPRATTGL